MQVGIDSTYFFGNRAATQKIALLQGVRAQIVEPIRPFEQVPNELVVAHPQGCVSMLVVRTRVVGNEVLGKEEVAGVRRAGILEER